jgi:UrcA family protein
MKSLALTLSAALLAAQPALAADHNAWRVGDDSIHLYYTDLDMNTAAGRATMLARIAKAAHRLCDSRLKVEEDECVAATLEKAAAAPGGRSLALALRESGATRLAQR